MTERDTMASPPASQEELSRKCTEADVIVFQRPMDIPRFELAKKLQSLGKKVVFDNDDTYKKDSGLPKIMTQVMEDIADNYIDKCETNLKNFARIADLVTVSTDFLKKEYDETNKNVVVLPNVIDPFDWGEPERNEGDTIRIGITGSVVTNDFLEIQYELEQISKIPNVKIVLFGVPPREGHREMHKVFGKVYKFWDSIGAECHDHVFPHEYPDKLNSLKLDMMLIPRLENYFNKCKSNIKFLEASMCEVPVLASTFPDSPYERDRKYFIPVKTGEWVEKVKELVENKDRRRDIGKKAREYTLQEYNINNKAHLWVEAYENITHIR